MPHWIMTLKTIMLELKKNLMIRKKLNTYILVLLFYVLNFKFVVF